MSLGGVLGSLGEARTLLLLPPLAFPAGLVNNYLVTWGWNSRWGRGLFFPSPHFPTPGTSFSPFHTDEHTRLRGLEEPRMEGDGQEGTARGQMRTKGRECRGAEGGGKALFTVTWLLVVPGRCSLQINPSRARQAPRPLPQPGVPSRAPGVAASPREASARQPGPLPPSPRFLQAMVAAASPTRTQQPLLPTCRRTLPAEHPASGLCHGLGLHHSAPSPFFRTGELGVPVGCSQPPARP